MALPVTITGISTAVAPVGPFKVAAGNYGIPTPIDSLTGGGTAASLGGPGVTNEAIAQTFTNPSASTINVPSVTVAFLAILGTPLGNVYAELTALDGSGFPSTVIATSNQVAASSCASTSITFTFSSAPTIAGNGLFGIVIRRTVGDINNCPRLSIALGSSYAGGQYVSYNGTTFAWTAPGSEAKMVVNSTISASVPTDAYYFFGRDATTGTTLQAYKSTAPDTSWASAATKTGFTTAILTLSGYQDGTTIHLLVCDGTAATSVATKYVSFDMVTDTFLATTETVAAAAANTGQVGTTPVGCAIVVRTNGEVVALYNGLQTKTSGTFRARMYYRRRTGVNTWSAEVQVDPNTAMDNQFPVAVAGGSSRVHFFWQGGTTALYYRTLTAANSIGASASNTTGMIMPGDGVYYMRGATGKIAITNGDSTPQKIFYSDDGDSLSGTIATPTAANAQAPHRIGVDPTTLDVSVIYRNSADSDLYAIKSTNDSVNWGAATSFFVGTVANADIAVSRSPSGSMYQRGSSVVIGYVVNDNGTWKYNEYLVRIITTADAWDASDKHASITLSNSDKTATATLGTLAGVHSTQSRVSGTAGKYYAEFKYEVGAGIIGLQATTGNESSAGNGITVSSSNGAIWQDVTQVGTVGSALSAGDVICFAWDAGAKTYWYRKNSDNWNNSGTADPATGVGGIVGNTGTVAQSLLCQMSTIGLSVTLRTRVANFTLTPPAGFTSWMGETTDGWDSNDKYANHTLSNNDKTVTTSIAAGNTRSTKTNITGKYYVELVPDRTSIGNLPHLGLKNKASVRDSLVDSYALESSTGKLWVETSPGSVIIPTGLNPTDVLSIAWDADAAKIWFRKNSEDWNPYIAGADPAAGTGSYSATLLSGDNVAPFFGANNANTSTTIRTRAAELTQTTPSGFLSWMGETLTVNPNVTVNVTGLSVTAAVGTPTITASVSVSVNVTAPAALIAYVNPVTVSIVTRTDVSVPIGGAPWTPADVGADLIAWYDFAATATVIQSGGFLTQWQDKSGNARHGNPASPTVLSVNSDGIYIANATSGPNLVIQMPTLPSKYFDMAFAGKPNPFGSYRTLMANATGNFHHVLLETGNDKLGTYSLGSPPGFFQAGSLTWPSVDGQIYFSGPDATSLKIGRDGDNPLDEIGEDFAPDANPALLNYGVGGGQGFGTAREFVFMTASRSADIRDKVSGYLAWKWDAFLGVTTHVAALPAGHPYKSVAPGGVGTSALTTSVGTVSVTITTSASTTAATNLVTTAVGQVSVNAKANVTLTTITALAVTAGTNTTVNAKANTNVANPALLTVSTNNVTVNAKANTNVANPALLTVSTNNVTVNTKANVNISTPTMNAYVGDVSISTATTIGVSVPVGGLWTPALIPTNLKAWFDAADAAQLTFGGSNLTVWGDKSPTVRNATPTGAAGPTLTTVNGLSSLRFDNQPLKINPTQSFGNFTAFAVFYADPSPSGTRNYERLADHNSANGWWMGRYGLTEQWGGGVKSVTDPYGYHVPLASGQVHELSIKRIGSTQYTSGNGGAVTNSGICDGGATTADFVWIATEGALVSSLYGVISELIVWSTDLLTADHATVEGYLAWKWGTQAKLPAGHTYKSAAPGGGASTALTTAVGTVTVNAKANTTVTGNPTTVAVGDVTIVGKANTTITGTSLATAVGAPTVGVPSANGFNIIIGRDLYVYAALESNNSAIINTDPVANPAGYTDWYEVTAVNVSVNVTGVSLTATTGTATVSLPTQVTVTTNLVTTAVGTVTITTAGNVGVSVAGQSLATAIGLSSVSIPKQVQVGSLQLTTAVGNVTVNAAARVDVTGQVITSANGGVSTSVGIGISANVSGQALTTAVNGVTHKLAWQHNTTGQVITPAVGTVTITQGLGVAPQVTGSQLTTAVGVVTFKLGYQHTVDGQAISVLAGGVSVSAGGSITASVSSPTITTAVGQVDVNTQQKLTVTGQAITVTIGPLAPVYTQTKVSVSGQQITSATSGAASVGVQTKVDVTGQQIAAIVSPVTMSLPKQVQVTGNQVAVTTNTANANTQQKIDVTGQQITTSIGGISATAGGSISTTVASPTLIASTSVVSITSHQNINVTGLGLTATIGITSASPSTIVNVTGLELTIAEPVAATYQQTKVSVTGQSLASAVGKLPVLVYVTGQQISASTNSVAAVNTQQKFTPTGVEATVVVGGVSVFAGGALSTTVTGLGLTTAVGIVDVSAQQKINVTGLGITTATRPVLTYQQTNVDVAGQELTIADPAGITTYQQTKVSVTGQAISVSVGKLPVLTYVTGQQLAVATNPPTVTTQQKITVEGQELTTAVNTVLAGGGSGAVVIGQALSTDVGQATVIGDASIPTSITSSLAVAVGGVNVVGKATASVVSPQIKVSAGSVYYVTRGDMIASVSGQQIIVSLGNYEIFAEEVGASVWTGAAWVNKPIKAWNGNAWVKSRPKVWTGSAWVI